MGASHALHWLKSSFSAFKHVFPSFPITNNDIKIDFFLHFCLLVMEKDGKRWKNDVKMLKKDFELLTVCQAPVHWLKYTTHEEEVKHENGDVFNGGDETRSGYVQYVQGIHPT